MQNDWVLVTSLARPKSLWAIRAHKLMKAVDFLGLELIACECAPIEPIMQDFLNNKLGSKGFVYEI